MGDMDLPADFEQDLTVLQRIGRGLSTTQDQLYVAAKLDELRKIKNPQQENRNE